MICTWRSIVGEPGARRARTRPMFVAVRFAESAGSVETLEGLVRYQAGDAIVRGLRGECWPVPRAAFEAKYVRTPSVGEENGETYRKRPLEVLALRLESDAVVLLSGGRGLLSGSKGEWIVDYGNDDLAIINDEIFSETYELLD